MDNTMSDTAAPRCAAAVTLKKIWKVRADRSYRVARAPRARSVIALRTIDGEGKLALRGGVFTLKADSLLFFSSADILHYETSGDFWHFYWFEFDSLSPMPLCRTLKVTDPARDWPQLCYTALPENPSYASALFGAMLAHWLQFAKERDNKNLLTERAILCLQGTLAGQETDLARIARSLGISGRYLRKIFREKTGLSPRDYLTRIKIDAAKERLEQTADKVSAIASELGFRSPYYFSNFFKTKTGLSPAAYRARLQNRPH